MDYQIGTASTELVTIQAGGNVGIGSSNPGAPLTVQGPRASLGGNQFNLWSDGAAANSYQRFGLGYGIYWNSAAGNYAITDATWNRSTFSNDNGSFHWTIGTGTTPTSYTYSQWHANDKMTLDTSGNLGIGNPSPAYKLDVTGSINATGNITAPAGTISGHQVLATYQDVAEWVPAGTSMQPGTVVILNRNRENEVIPSVAAYDTAVAGVVSAQPGIILGEGSATKAQIATTGRVKVRVDASTHAIAIGDLLVTSGTEGKAMYSEPMTINGRRFHQPGTVIGKALQPLANGQGEILVLLSLQ